MNHLLLLDSSLAGHAWQRSFGFLPSEHIFLLLQLPVFDLQTPIYRLNGIHAQFVVPDKDLG
jgi:hypothetical protein